MATKHTSAAASPVSVPRLAIDGIWAACALGAAALLAIAAFQPLWTMTLIAPQYPGGLQLTAYGTRMAGRLSEINSLNHYVGVRAIEPDSVLELALFPYLIGTLIAIVVLSAFVKSWKRIPLRWIAIGAVWAAPIGFLVDLQYWLYSYGHDLDPTAPFRIPEFTPKVIGKTQVINFHSETMVDRGFWLMVAAALLITFGPWLIRFLRDSWRNTGTTTAAALVVTGAVMLAAAGVPGIGGASSAAAQAAPQGIQAMIDAAEPGDTVTVPPGVYEGAIRIDKSLTLVGEGWPVIDGKRTGDVVTVTAADVTIRGFVVQGSSRVVSQEPGGIRLAADNGMVEGNRIQDVLYGVILIDSNGHAIVSNEISSIAENDAERRGHAVYMWNTSHNVITDNVLTTAKDGIFVGFANFNDVRNNTVTNVRYGIHYMYSDDNVFTDNTFTDSVAGAAIMYSRRLTLEGNTFANNRSTASGYGILMKDVDDVLVRHNLIHHNRLGLTMEGAPQAPEAFVRLEENLIAYNQTAIEATTTTNATFVGNSFIGNLQEVESRGGDIGPKNAWSEDGRGNYWDKYQGYDAAGDGVGDIAFRYEGLYEDLAEDNEALQAFKFTFAQAALDMTARWFPVYRPAPKVVDEAPLMSPAITLPAADGAGARIAVLAMAAALLVVPAGGLLAARSTFRRGWT